LRVGLIAVLEHRFLCVLGEQGCEGDSWRIWFWAGLSFVIGVDGDGRQGEVKAR